MQAFSGVLVADVMCSSALGACRMAQATVFAMDLPISSVGTEQNFLRLSVLQAMDDEALPEDDRIEAAAAVRQELADYFLKAKAKLQDAGPAAFFGPAFKDKHGPCFSLSEIMHVDSSKARPAAGWLEFVSVLQLCPADHRWYSTCFLDGYFRAPPSYHMCLQACPAGVVCVQGHECWQRSSPDAAHPTGWEAFGGAVPKADYALLQMLNHQYKACVIAQQCTQYCLARTLCTVGCHAA